jgi:hypothetical protein
MLGHLRLPLEEIVTRVTEVLSVPRPSFLGQFLPIGRSDNSRRIHIKLHDTMEPDTLKPSLMRLTTRGVRR